MTPEFSKVFNLATLYPSLPQNISLIAEAHERAALGERFDVEICLLKCDLTLEVAPDKVSTKAIGFLTAQVVQVCGFTLEPFTKEIETGFEVYFSPQGDPKVIHLEDADQEYYLSPEIDLGEITAQYLCLHLDPFPQHPLGCEKTEAEPVKKSPFQLLEGLLTVDDGSKPT